MSAPLTAAVELAAPRPASQHAHMVTVNAAVAILQMQCLMLNGPILAQRACATTCRGAFTMSVQRQVMA